MWDDSIWEIFERGGPIMWVLLGLSIAGVMLILDRLWMNLWWYQNIERQLATLEPMIQQKDWEQAEQYCQTNGPYTHIARTYLRYRDHKASVREDVLKREGSGWLQLFETRLRWLLTIAQISPMIGLLGTVVGLVITFQQIDHLQGQVNPSDLAGGIWVALLTTVFGLIIAIPCLAAYNAFDQRVDTIGKNFTKLVSYMDEWCQVSVEEKAKFASQTSSNGGDGATTIGQKSISQ